MHGTPPSRFKVLRVVHKAYVVMKGFVMETKKVGYIHLTWIIVLTCFRCDYLR